MNYLPRNLFIAALAAAATITACSDGTAPTTTLDLNNPQSDRSASSPDAAVGASNFTTVDVPGATTTLPLSINDAGVIAGRYLTAGRTHGFIRTAEGEFSTIDFPGSGFTVAAAVNNDGVIAGWYTLPASSAIRHGFLLRDGVFTTFDPPASIFNNPLGINDRGDIVGRFCIRTPCREPGSGDFHGFVFRDGVFTMLDVPGSRETNVWSTNDRGDILGGFGPATGGVQIFLMSNGELTAVAPPAGKFFSEDNGGLNARGDAVGKYCDASPCVTGPTGHGFAFINGAFTTIDFPGARGTASFAINARRDVVGGWFDTAGVLHGYMVSLKTHG